MKMPYILGSTSQDEVASGVTKFKIAMIADLDKLSKGTDVKGRPCWKSLIAIGSLTYDFKNQKATVEMDAADNAISIQSGYSRGMKGLELSELIKFNGRYYSVCDKTGIVYDVSDGKAIPRAILADGDGNQASGFKGEWMTCKDDKLFVGSTGIDFMAGDKLNTDKKWIKQLDTNGGVQHVDWNANYDAMRRVLGCEYPGYVIHESAVWSDVHKQWFFMPRKISKDIYDPKLDDSRCGNTLLRSSEDFSNIQHLAIGTLRPTHGCSSFKFVPGTKDTVIVAIKSEELGNSQKTFITVFTIDGKVILDDMHLVDAKYEGLEFV